jgi:hypothetical protein
MYSRWILLVALVLLPAAAWAQSADPPRVSVGAGVGLAFPLHGDFDFTPWAWEADVRVALSRRGVLEVAAGEWRHSESRVVHDIQVTPPPGTIGRFEQATGRTQRMLQANLLFQGATGRLHVTAGGGVGLLQFQRRTRIVTSGCSPGALCGTTEYTFTNASGTAQAVAGLEVAIASGLTAYGQARFIANIRDVGGSETRLTAGLRWGFGR